MPVQWKSQAVRRGQTLKSAMGIDIDRLTEAEPTGPNRRIAGRLRFLHPMRAHAAMLKFPVGGRVCFGTGDFRKVAGTLRPPQQKKPARRPHNLI